MLSRMTNFWRNIFAKVKTDRDLDEEVRCYSDLLAQEKIHGGMNPEEARRAVKLQLGGIEQVKEEVRQARTGAWLDSVFQDFRYAARTLRKNPGFSAIAILTLALGIGANTAIFTLTYAVILKSLAVPNPQQLVRYTFRSGTQDLGVSGPLYDALRKHEQATQDLLAWSASNVAVQENGAITNVDGALLSGNSFRVLELQPLMGRVFTDADDQLGGGSNGYEALVSYAYWKDHLQGNPSVIGRSLIINAEPVTIIGVLPQGFEGVVAGQRADIVLPLSFEEVLNAPHPLRRHPGSFWLTVIGRLNPGATLQSAQSNLLATQNSVRDEADPSHRFLSGFFAAFQLGVESGHSGRSSLKLIYSRPLIVLEILVGMVLLLCCANTALLVLARVTNRLREFAVRSALGASGRRLFRQVLSEVALLAFGGLLAGIALGWIAATSLVSMLAAIGQPPPLDAAPQVAVLAFTAAISVLSAFVAGAWPAFRASRVEPILGLKENAVGYSSKALGECIVPSQVAVSVVLLAAASLLGQSFFHLLREDSGFRSENAVMAEVDLTPNKISETVATRNAQQIVDRLAAAPGIDSAAVMSSPPLKGWWSSSHYYSLDHKGAVHTDMQIWPEAVTPDYFSAIGTSIREGRAFNRADATAAQVCILSMSAAHNFFPGEEALGRFVYTGGSDVSLDGKSPASAQDPCEVIGVAADARFESLREPPERAIYRVIPQNQIGSDFFLVVRSRNITVATSAIRDAVRNTVPGSPEPAVFTFDQLVAAHLHQERMLTALSACFAAVALLLTALGLYGLLSRNVVRRRKEIGLRLALGASPRDALGLVLRQGLRLVIVGSAVGLIATVATTKLLGTLLVGLQPNKPLLLIAAVAVLFAVAVATSCVPAWQAARVDPMEALRYE
jgi:predicted permease